MSSLPYSTVARARQWLCIVTIALALGACQTSAVRPTQLQMPSAGLIRQQQLQAVQQFSVEAKLAVQYAGKGYTARMQWQHDGSHDVLDIYSPLGQQVAHIDRDPIQVSLTDQQGHVHQAQDIASLTEQLLGWRLPLQGLSEWILGLPAANSPYQAQYFPAGEPAQLLQAGWQIDYDSYQSVSLPATAPDSVSLPDTLRLRNEDLRLKLHIIDWQASPR